MKPLCLAALTALFGAALVPPLVRAQEPPRVPGARLPSGYYTRLRQRPQTFQLRDGWIARAAQARAANAAVSGTLPLVVVPALFADSPDPQIAAADIQRVLFDGPSANGTASEFYAEASLGRFTLGGQTLPWVRTSLTMGQVVGASYGLGNDAQVGQYLVEALALNDAVVDFGQFDNDGPDGMPNSGDDDGKVDAVAFEFLEVAASCGGPAIWPHRSSIDGWLGAPYVSNDVRTGGGNIIVNDYIVQSVTDCGGVNIQTAATISHELGHVLGLPDLYDASQGILATQRRWVLGCWSLMAAGSWGCGSDDRVAWVRPTHMGAWERTQLGWVDSVADVGEAIEQEFTLAPVRMGGTVLRIQLVPRGSAATGEYLLVEYRTTEGFDQDLPASGVLIYHVDPNISGNWPCDTCPQRYQVALLEADGNGTLQRSFAQGGNRGEPGDAWGAAGPGRLTDRTTPSSRLNSGAASSVTIDDITLAGGVAHVTVSAVTIVVDRLVQPFVQNGEAPLSAAELSYLDRVGNGNGSYDVGDLRAYLKR